MLSKLIRSKTRKLSNLIVINSRNFICCTFCCAFYEHESIYKVLIISLPITLWTLCRVSYTLFLSISTYLFPLPISGFITLTYTFLGARVSISVTLPGGISSANISR